MYLFLRVRKREGRSSNGDTTLSKVKGQSDVCVSRKLDRVLQDLVQLEDRGRVTGFSNSTDNVDRLDALAEDTHDALMDYQVRPRSSRTYRA